MSGAKTGTIVTVQVAGASLGLPLAGAAVAAAGALLGVGVLAVGLVGKGMVRVGREVYNQVDDQIRIKIVKEELERQKRFRELFKKKRFEERGTSGIEEDISELETAVVSGEHEKDEAFMKTIESLTKNRATREIAGKMKRIVSDRMEEVCREIKEKRAQAKVAEQEKEREVKAPDFSPRYEEIRRKSKRLVETGVYLDVVAEIESTLETMEKNGENFDRLIGKLNRLEDNFQKSPLLGDLAHIYNEWAHNKTINLLKATGDEESAQLLSEFEKAYRAKRDLAESGTFQRSGIDTFKKEMQACLLEAERHEARIIFDEDLENIKKAMSGRGFVGLTLREEDGYMKIRGRRKDDPGKVSHVWLKTLRNIDANAPQLRMEAEGYDYTEKKEQNEAIIGELASLGVTIAWEETPHDMNGNLVREYVEALLKAKWPHLTCKVKSGNRIEVEGKGTHHWAVGDTQDNFCRRVLDGETPIPEKERLKEA